MRSCIAVLTRGYSDISGYDLLIKRNLAIQMNLCNKSIDILILHEGNITGEHQSHIIDKTPCLEIHFINVNNGLAFKSHKSEIEFDPGTSLFGIGYRHMCSFWFVDFWNFVGNYDKMLRIDEDCFIDCNIDAILNEVDRYNFICGKWIEDHEFVTIGMNNLSLDFIKEYNIAHSRKPSGPYTNVCAINLRILRTNTLLSKYINAVDESDNIYKYRWGDLPLWGEVIYYIFGMESILVDANIKYFHESHDMKVNF
jgi:hypothetical protein